MNDKTKEPAIPEAAAPPPQTEQQPATHVAFPIELLNEVTRTIGDKLTWSEANPLMTRIQKEAVPLNLAAQIPPQGMNGA